MTTLVSVHALNIEHFRLEHGDVTTWSTADWEVHQNLVEIALAHGPVGGLRDTVLRRTTAVALIAYVTALYTVTELASAIRGPWPTGLGYHLADVVRGPGQRADARLRLAGDLLFRQQLIRAALRVSSAVDRLSARLSARFARV
ncbi:hypothetical protein QWJ26_24505 [Streptomyces sp. CSDS2]|uniref:hypothetical protein n=1 Tax=Streptomyces sp. CSDS2 TaxID=3055051 RepID=UPI0025B00B2B|nr:hypothetical protein [Streptomyces sp. CSDS2]MDN3262911.1 hypothetical protein [Streptomyces sp. CSDS2]